MAPTALPTQPARDPAREAALADLSTESLEDLRLAERVARRLRETGYSPLRDVKVATRARLVVLRGQVPSYYLKQVAQETTLAVPGTHRVRNDLAVVRPV